MHVFLTGDRGSGKSWLVSRISAELKLPCRGFVTRFLEQDRHGASLYMFPASGPALPDEEHLVARRIGGSMQAVPERFDTLGVQLLRDARCHPGSLILMDECGFLEREALSFQQEILRCLEDRNPVFGVLRANQPWHAFIKEHPRVAVFTVTEENREDLAERILPILRQEIFSE